MIVEPEIRSCGDGSNTLIHPVLGDAYHSLQGAVGESMHIYIEAGFRSLDRDPLRILEVGFGSGLNALLTLREAMDTGRTVEYHTVELYPVAERVVRSLGYDAYCSPEAYTGFLRMHALPWDAAPVAIDRSFTFHKINADLREVLLPAGIDLVYFDAFSPDTQPELWSRSVFERLYGAMNPGGVLVTYSAKGVVKQALRDAGFIVKRLPGALGKHHMLRAVRQ